MDRKKMTGYLPFTMSKTKATNFLRLIAFGLVIQNLIFSNFPILQ